MSGSIQRINTCANCVYAHITGPEQILCRRNPPAAHAVVDVPRDEKGRPVAMVVVGSVAVWPQVQPNEWCGHHSRQLIEQVRDVPKRLQTFGGMG
jgi:hypothetical protein